MPELEVTVLENGCQIHEDIDQHLLEGGPLYMNEFLFFHASSKTLIASDAYYGGYTTSAQPEWFGRIWFKCTKGTFRKAKLPIYRTARILTHGNIDTLIACCEKLIKGWDFNTIVHAHGTNFWPAKPKESFLAGWEEVVAMREKSSNSRGTKRCGGEGESTHSVSRSKQTQPKSADCGNQTYSLTSHAAAESQQTLAQKGATGPMTSKLALVSEPNPVGNETYSMCA
jgi:hypothetical protein